MPRTILVVPDDADPTDYLEQAAAAGASEIAVGVPPALAEELDHDALPTVYLEADPPSPPAPSAPEVLDGQIAYGEVKIVDPLTVTLDGVDTPAGRLAGYIPEAKHYVKLTRLQGQWVVEDRVLLHTT